MVEDYEFWLFDLDGTLVDADWAYTRDVYDRVGDRLNHEFTDREAELLWHGLSGARNPLLREWGFDPEAFWPAFHAEEDPQRRARATYLHDDAERLLDALEDRDVPMGVVTHCQRFLAEPVLDRLGLAERFDAVVCCTDEVGWKPDPAPVRHAMAELGVADSGTAEGGSGTDAVRSDGGSDVGTGDATGTVPDHRGVLVGDGPNDIGAAWNAGLDGVHVERHGADRRGWCVLGDRRVSSLDELLDASASSS
ncbi:HAD family hydrolase [Halobium salinum]|uniref:HAD family hydrolase n=1 Tax=Halobium salinum TaxID=1364940 RepID=A0ABD5P8W9_9EURY|nr:HAD family hydrolase [Halobium salinum]